jgi:hypothetical protein
MIKFFQQHYNLATKEDINRLIEKIDKLEQSIRESALAASKSPASAASTRKKRSVEKQNASDRVYDVIAAAKNGIRFPEIKARTGFEDKKLRNIIYRLGKLGKIKNKKRGLYISA